MRPQAPSQILDTLAANCNACPTHRKSDRRQAQLQRSARTPVAFSDTIVTDDALFGVTFSPTLLSSANPMCLITLVRLWASPWSTSSVRVFTIALALRGDAEAEASWLALEGKCCTCVAEETEGACERKVGSDSDRRNWDCKWLATYIGLKPASCITRQNCTSAASDMPWTTAPGAAALQLFIKSAIRSSSCPCLGVVPEQVAITSPSKLMSKEEPILETQVLGVCLPFSKEIGFNFKSSANRDALP
mmetsp:Transcript_26972/g.37903  ORF Transcript_26972/g.37903 Transcript_26972/m.37903 type:complete len:247 (-) Transcript_26972:218-958(-)